MRLVHDDLVELVEDLETVGDLAEHAVVAVQVAEVVVQREDELRAEKVVAGANHRDVAPPRVSGGQINRLN